jgi:rhombotail lipoprotein
MEKEQDLRKLRSAGFTEATDDMIVNLDTELEGFRTAVEEGLQAQVEWREGSGGGGSVSPAWILLLAAAVIVRLRRRL